MMLPRIRFLAILPIKPGTPTHSFIHSWLRDWYTGDPFDRTMELTTHYGVHGEHIEIVMTAPMASPAKEYFVVDEVQRLNERMLVIWQPVEE